MCVGNTTPKPSQTTHDRHGTEVSLYTDWEIENSLSSVGDDIDPYHVYRHSIISKSNPVHLFEFYGTCSSRPCREKKKKEKQTDHLIPRL